MGVLKASKVLYELLFRLYLGLNNIYLNSKPLLTRPDSGDSANILCQGKSNLFTYLHLQIMCLLKISSKCSMSICWHRFILPAGGHKTNLCTYHTRAVFFWSRIWIFIIVWILFKKKTFILKHCCFKIIRKITHATR